MEDPVIKALQIDVVLDCITSFLTFTELKYFRLVCHKWGTVADPIFRRKAEICLNFDTGIVDGRMLYHSFLKYDAPEDLTYFFANGRNQECKFQAMKFSFGVPYSLTHFRDFFATEGNVMCLSLSHVCLRECVEAKTTKIGQLCTSNLLTGMSKLNSLTIDSISHNTQFIVSLKSLVELTTLRNIDLKNCKLQLTGDTIRPMSLRLVDMKFFQDQKFLDSILLNSFVNFDDMKSLTLIYYDYFGVEHRTTKIHLNLLGNVTMNNVSLKYFCKEEQSDDIINLESSFWNVTTLTLSGVPFTKDNNLKVEKLCISQANMAPKFLPSPCEVLSISDVSVSSWDISMPKTKCLTLNGYSTLETVLSHICRIFYNLTELKLVATGNTGARSYHLDMNLVPASVKRLLLHIEGLEFVNNGYKRLEILILKVNLLKMAQKQMKHFNSDVVIVYVPETELEQCEELITSFTASSDACLRGEAKSVLGVFGQKNVRYQQDDFVLPRIELTGEFYYRCNSDGAKMVDRKMVKDCLLNN